MGYFLKPLKRKPKKNKFASFDVETADKDNNFYMVGLYHDDKYKAFYSPDTFYNYINTYLRGYWIVATNLGFDFSSTFLNSKYWTEFKIIENGGLMLMASHKPMNIKFIDTLNYHKASLKQLGEIINLPKLDHPDFLGKRKPKNQEEHKILLDYNKRDCEISLKFLEWFNDQINSLGGELKITIASTSLDVFKRNFLKKSLCKEEYNIKNQDIKNKIFKAYYGGRTETIKRGYFEKLNYYDFNSLYPSVMINPLPYPNSVKHIPKGSIEEIYTREGVSHVVVEHTTNELPLLPFRKDGKLIFPKGKFDGWYTHLELRKAIENGYLIHDVKETISYKTDFYPFKDYINILYDKRLKAKKTGSSEQLIYKLLMNSLYGKFGERIHNNVIHFDVSVMSQHEIDSLPKSDNFVFSDSGKGYLTIEEECNSNHVFPILPVYISALGRLKLWEKARNLDPVYMDTDSIVTKHDLPSSNKLGELELEHKIKRGVFIKPKMYYFTNSEDKEILKLKGVPHITREQFEKVLRKETIHYSKFVKIKEGIRRGLKVNSVIDIEKYISLEDSKREWDIPFSLIPQNSKPLKIDEVDKNSIQENRISNEVKILHKQVITS